MAVSHERGRFTCWLAALGLSGRCRPEGRWSGAFTDGGSPRLIVITTCKLLTPRGVRHSERWPGRSGRVVAHSTCLRDMVSHAEQGHRGLMKTLVSRFVNEE